MKANRLRLFGLGALFLLLLGCTFHYGSPPRTDRLDALKLGVSSKAEVMSVLGAPRGNGMLRHSANPLQYVQRFTEDPGRPIGLAVPVDFDPTQRTMWFYEYQEGTTSRMDLKYLLVFFLGDVYDGHLWFSARSVLQ